MKKNMYNVTELAVLYFPESTPYNARRRFLKLLKSEKDLWRLLKDWNFRPRQRQLTPKQYEKIIDILGKPEPDDEDFGRWIQPEP